MMNYDLLKIIMYIVNVYLKHLLYYNNLCRSAASTVQSIPPLNNTATLAFETLHFSIPCTLHFTSLVQKQCRAV